VFLRVARLHGRRNPFVAQEGLPLLALVLAVTILLIRYSEPIFAVVPAVLLVLLYMVFRDPLRHVPSVALGVFSPVDGQVVEAGRIEDGETGKPALRVLIRVDSLGTYTARSPIEGQIMDLGKKALWLQTDEGQDVVLSFSGYRLGLPPRSFARFGERLGQGQRCAYLRLTRFAEIQLPANGKLLVEPGQIVVAGTDVIGNVHSPR
jgi:phosphatidylserine decarboxylase